MSDSNYEPYPFKHDLPRPLYRVAYGSRPYQQDDTAHLALFVSHPPHAHYVQIRPQQGMVCHAGAIKESNLKKRSNGLLWHVTDVGKTSAHNDSMILGAMVTQKKLRETGVAAHARDDYKLLTNNCQHFAVETVVELNILYPQSVPWEAVVAVKERGTLLTKSRSFLSWDRLTAPVRSPQIVA